VDYLVDLQIPAVQNEQLLRLRHRTKRLGRKLKRKSDSSQNKTQLVLEQEFVAVAVCCYPIHV